MKVNDESPNGEGANGELQTEVQTRAEDSVL